MLLVVVIFSGQICFAQTRGPEDMKTKEKVSAPAGIRDEKDKRIKELEAEAQYLKGEYASLEKAAQGKISALEDLVKELQAVIANIRSQAGNTEPAPNATR